MPASQESPVMLELLGYPALIHPETVRRLRQHFGEEVWARMTGEHERVDDGVPEAR